jgi:hypothetical protein
MASKKYDIIVIKFKQAPQVSILKYEENILYSFGREKEIGINFIIYFSN